MPRRSYDQYCAAARALDAVGDRWTLLIVRELLAGPRRYTDLHADLPGVSTDMLATRLKDMERDGLATRRRLAAPASVYVYELTPRGRQLLPVLLALGEWGAAELGERRATDAVRAHWLALPLLRELGGLGESGVVEVRVDEGEFHVRVGEEPGSGYGEGRYEGGEPDARVVLGAEVSGEVARGEVGLAEAVGQGRVEVTGVAPLAKALRASAPGAADFSPSGD
ncbi:helix-turn-helix transcriptional regulator [Streptomyces kunmingensis]|uniref:Helix-turn-helix transcriptional regulator n=1 Tax=Streptomyces kunmingensis TaxID=68225 RepID=A0ABU6C8J7_9ACTN|nr:helix-turn-helix domain-containing protein [Streptomyces kunmingensis]MEB3960958.1 helix-turn-helix transcriptional regulator [Streptomyces kunmingensis]